MGKKPRVCAYARVSTETDDQMGSYDNQIDAYTNMIKSNPDWTFAGIYADPGITGTTDERPEFQRMLKDAAKHRIDIIIIKSVSRFARNTLVAIETLNFLKKHGVRVIFQQENIDTATHYSDLMMTIMAAFAQEESRNISERSKSGLRMRAKNGKVRFSQLYGYCQRDGEDHVVVPEEAAVVCRIYDEYVHGTGTAMIANKLNSEGIPSPKGLDWNSNGVLNLLRNERYVGDILTNKCYTVDHLTHKMVKNNGEVEQYYLPNHHAPIVDREIFDLAQETIEVRLNHQYPFADRVFSPYSDRRLSKKSGVMGRTRACWYSEEDAFCIDAKLLEEAVLKAYNELDVTGVKDETTIRIKEMYPTFSTVDYWWVKELISEITFGKHYADKDTQTVIVHWFCEKESVVPSGAGTVYKMRRRKERAERKVIEERIEKRVTKIPAKRIPKAVGV